MGVAGISAATRTVRIANATPSLNVHKILFGMFRYLMKLARHLDEQLKAMRASRLRIDNADGALILSLIDTPLAESGMSIRPTTREEVRAHLKDFGIDGDLVRSHHYRTRT